MSVEYNHQFTFDELKHTIAGLICVNKTKLATDMLDSILIDQVLLSDELVDIAKTCLDAINSVTNYGYHHLKNIDPTDLFDALLKHGANAIDTNIAIINAGYLHYVNFNAMADDQISAMIDRLLINLNGVYTVGEIIEIVCSGTDRKLSVSKDAYDIICQKIKTIDLNDLVIH